MERNDRVEPKETDTKLISNKLRIVDMMLSAHSVLRDRNSRKALLVDIVSLVISSILVAAIWANAEIYEFLKIATSLADNILGITSLAIFILALINFRVDWKQKAELHNNAHKRLAFLKSKLAEWASCSGDNGAKTTLYEILKECQITMESVPAIPENRFNSLKAIHLRKVELSKALSRTPGASVYVIRIKLFFGANWRALKSKMS